MHHTPPEPGSPFDMSIPHPSFQILLVDDEPLICRLLGKIIRRLGGTPYPFATAPSALEAFRSSSPPIDLALIDVTLQNGESGAHLAKQLKELRADLPVILMSGGDPAELAAFQADAFLQKPFDSRQLRQAFAQLGLLDERSTRPR